jgi:hypothetical protein
MKRLNYFIFLVAVLFTYTANSQDKAWTPGHIQDSVLIQNHPEESYALYLPSEYKSNQERPVVYIFDPLARGKQAIQHFVLAAEKYNLILICSNNAQNGPYDRNIDIANRLFESTFQSFRFDTNRIYIAGFSGGARFATSIAVLTNKFAGVIACGAGFSNNRVNRPARINQFSYLGIIGNKDMNFQELLEGKQYLDQINLSNHVIQFDGEHKWPPDSVILDGFNWLQLEAYKKGIVPINHRHILNMYSDDIQKAKSYSRSNSLLKAYQTYQDVTKNYSSFINTDSVRSIMKELKRQKAFKKQKKQRNKAYQREKQLISEYYNLLTKQLNGLQDSDFYYWQREIKKLNKFKTSKNKELQNAGYRLLEKLWVWGYETGLNLIDKNQYHKAIFAHRIMKIVKPGHIYPHVRLARDYCLINNTKQCLQYLDKAVELGYNNKEMILSLPEMKSIVDHKKIKQILDKMQ